MTSLRAFLGLLNFYSKFLSSLQSKLHPLHKLLMKNVRFEWSDECESVFNFCKQAIMISPILAFYDPTRPLSLVCDASPYGVGAILNIIVDGVERPVYMASASLSEAERNYSQYDREALAVVFGLKKFHKFVYGHHVSIFTDCEALPPIFSGRKDFGGVINSRFLRWLLFVQNYDFEIRHRPSKYTVNADALSRLPCEDVTGWEESSLNVKGRIGSFNVSEEDVLNFSMISKETMEQEECRVLYYFIKDGWPNKDEIPFVFETFFKFRFCVDIQDGCIFYGDRVFIPPKYRQGILRLLHEGHMGIVKCKQLARKSVWWPNLDKEVEEFIQSCSLCQRFASGRTRSELVSWPKTSFPFERIHIDHFFIANQNFLVIVDDFSKWLEVKRNSNVSTSCVIKSLREFFSVFGLPKVFVSGNIGTLLCVVTHMEVALRTKCLILSYALICLFYLDRKC